MGDKQGYFKIPEGRIKYFDVDDTLVRWRLRPDEQAYKFECRGKEVLGNAVKANVEELIIQSLKGSRIVVWSKAGSDWAEAAVIGLGLEKYVDAIMTKPDVVYDDLPVETWITKRLHLEEENDGTSRA